MARLFGSLLHRIWRKNKTWSGKNSFWYYISRKETKAKKRLCLPELQTVIEFEGDFCKAPQIVVSLLWSFLNHVYNVRYPGVQLWLEKMKKSPAE